jgi:hypothetical protein
MDDRLRICLWMIGGGGFGAVLGAGFGALAAVFDARSGGAAGTGLARRVAESLLETSLHPPSPTGRAVLVGATDGFFFLGILGLLGGAILGICGRSANELLVLILIGSLLLSGGAILFGTLAYALTYGGARLLYGAVGGFLGWWFARTLFGWEYGAGGFVLGTMLAQVLCFAARSYSPKFQPPQAGKAMPQSRSEVETDITGSPPSRASDDFFHKPDSFEEH